MTDGTADHEAASSSRSRSRGRQRDQAFDAALGARIRAFRVAALMSQGALGECVGISFQQIQKYELGKDRVAADMLQGLAIALGVHPGSFFDTDMPVSLGRPTSEVKRTLKSADILGRIRDPRVVKRLLALAKVLGELDGAEVEPASDDGTP